MTATRQGIVHATLVASDLAVTCDAYLAQLRARLLAELQGNDAIRLS